MHGYITADMLLKLVDAIASNELVLVSLASVSAWSLPRLYYLHATV